MYYLEIYFSSSFNGILFHSASLDESVEEHVNSGCLWFLNFKRLKLLKENKHLNWNNNIKAQIFNACLFYVPYLSE
jgi:hypothetical protein